MLKPAPTHPMPVAVHVLRYVSNVLQRTAMVSGGLALAVLFLAFAIDEGAFGLTGAARAGMSRFAWNVVLAAAIGGLAAPLLLSTITRYLQYQLQRRALDEVATRPDVDRTPPVAWQHKAVTRKRAGMSMLFLAIPLVPTAAFFILVFQLLVDEYPGEPLFTTLRIVCIALTALGILLIVAARAPVKGAAHDLWGHKQPVTDPREATRATEPAHGLARLDQTGHWLTVASLVPFVATLFASFTNHYAAGTWTLVAGVLILLGATAVRTVVAFRLRATLLRHAMQPNAPEPAWRLLGSALKQEVPYQSALGSVHTAAVICLGVGIAGIRTGPEYPLSDIFQVFSLLATLGGILVLFHASGRFWRRRQTATENEFLLRRWPPISR